MSPTTPAQLDAHAEQIEAQVRQMHTLFELQAQRVRETYEGDGLTRWERLALPAGVCAFLAALVVILARMVLDN